MAGSSITWERLRTATHRFFRRHWQRALIIRDWLRLSEESFHLFMAMVVGILAGLATWAYYGVNQLLQWLAFSNTGDLLEFSQKIPGWLRLTAPAAGGLIAGLVLFWGLRLIGNPGLTNLLEAVAAGDGRLPLRTGLITAASSLVSISTGASIGREGLLVQLSATLGSKLGQWSRWPPYRLRMLVACGAAAGMAASYNAPLAGSVFAAQIVLGNFSMSLFAPLVVASVVATIIARGFFGASPLYAVEVPRFEFNSLTQLPWFIVLGIVSGLLGASFLKTLRWGETLFRKSRWPLFVRMAVAGLAVGCLGLYYPQVWGNGYSAASQILQQTSMGSGDTPLMPFAGELRFIAGLLLAKYVATVVTVGSGAVGGVFTPTLFLGAGLGSLFGSVLHHSQLGLTLPTGMFALVGMASVLAATIHSPLLAVLMIFELSLNYSIVPPLMLATVIATLVARRFQPESVYTEPLRRKGVELQRETGQLGAATQVTVADIMRAPVPPLRENTSFQEMANRFLTLTHNFLPVVDKDQRLLGMVALHDLKEWLNAGQELNSVIAYDMMRPPPNCLTPNQRLADALPTLLSSEARNVPVVNNSQDRKLLGTVTRADALALLSEAISARTTHGSAG